MLRFIRVGYTLSLEAGDAIGPAALGHTTGSSGSSLVGKILGYLERLG